MLKISKLNKKFGSVYGANNIDFNMKSREVVGVIGSNGAGKTTFCNIITGYTNPDSGKILFLDKEISKLGVTEIKAHGIHRSFQIPQLFDKLTVLENVAITYSSIKKNTNKYFDKLLTKSSKKEALNIINKFSISEYSYYKVSSLPQGIRKILDIVIAMIGKPSLILLDEPTAGVSSKEKFLIMDKVMDALKSLHVAIMFIEHDMEVIEKYSERVIAFYEGRIIADGNVNDVLSNESVIKYVVGKK